MKLKKKKNSALKAGVWYTISNFFVKGIAFFSMPIFTRLMTSHDIGVFSNIVSWFHVLAIITTFEIYSSVSIARFDYKEDLDTYISSNLFLGTIITLFFYILALILHVFVEDFLMIDFATLNIIFIYLLVYPSVQMYQIRKQIGYEYKPIIVVSLLSAVLSTGISVLLVILMQNQLMGRIIGYFVPLIIISFVVYIMLLKKGKRISKKYWKYALMVSFPLIWHLLAGYLLSSSDKIMITKIISPEANALYSVSYTISTIANILWMSMNSAWSPWAYERMDKKDYKSLKENSKPYLLFFVVVVISMLLLTPEILLIMGGKEYMEAKYVMPPVMIGYIFQFVYSFYVNIEFYHKKQKNIAIGTIVAAIINIILNAIFIPMFGYIAAAYTTLIGYISLFTIHYLFVRKLKCTSWYDTKFFAFVLGLSLLSIFIFNFLYSFDIIRYIVFGLLALTFLVFMIRKRKLIIKAVKQKSLKSLINIIKRNDEK